MPRKPEWFHRIPFAIQLLQSLPHPLIDRRSLQSILSVSPRTALRILQQLGAQHSANTLLIPRPELLRKLQALARGESVQRETRRIDKIESHLAAWRNQQAARRRQIPISHRPPTMPPGVDLFPGRLEITFSSPENLLEKLYGLAQAIANDYDSFASLASTDASHTANDGNLT